MFNLLGLLMRDNPSDETNSYFECEDMVEAALNYLDNHPDCTLEEYESWLTHRENAIKEIKESKHGDN